MLINNSYSAFVMFFTINLFTMFKAIAMEEISYKNSLHLDLKGNGIIKEKIIFEFNNPHSFIVEDLSILIDCVGIRSSLKKHIPTQYTLDTQIADISEEDLSNKKCECKLILKNVTPGVHKLEILSRYHLEKKIINNKAYNLVKISNIKSLYSKTNGFSIKLPYGNNLAEDLVFGIDIKGNPKHLDPNCYRLIYKGDGVTEVKFTEQAFAPEIVGVSLQIPAYFLRKPIENVFWDDNITFSLGWMLIFLLLIYYAYVWNILDGAVVNEVIVDSKKILNFTPASICYLEYGGYSKRVYALTLLELARKSYIKILEGDNFIIKRISYNDAILTMSEKAFIDKFFQYSSKIEYTEKNVNIIYQSGKAIEKNISKDLRKSYITSCRKTFNAGFFFSILGIIICIISQGKTTSYSLLLPLSTFFLNVLAIFLLEKPFLYGDKFNAFITGVRLFFKGYQCSLTDKKNHQLISEYSLEQKKYDQYIGYALALKADKWWTDLLLKEHKEAGTFKPSWYEGLAFNNFSRHTYRRLMEDLSNYDHDIN